MSRNPGQAGPNNFDSIRLAAAFAVLVSHSYALTGQQEPAVRGVTLGHVGVLIFFAMSGFLVTQSWDREPVLRRFALKRALRIFPALAAVLLISTFVIGPLATSLSTGAYLGSGDTYIYFIKNLSLVEPVFRLPGVFVDNPYPHSVNGSLWTLPSEMHAYIVVLALGCAGGLRTRSRATVAWFAIGAVALFAPQLFFKAATHPTLMIAFVVGSLLYVWRRELRWSWLIAFALGAIWTAVPARVISSELALAMTIPYVALMLAYRTPRIAPWLAGRDFSYGTYLWAFPVQQLIAKYGGIGDPGTMLILSTAVTLPLAAISWFYIERPALAVKTRISSRRQEGTPIK